MNEHQPFLLFFTVGEVESATNGRGRGRGREKGRGRVRDVAETGVGVTYEENGGFHYRSSASGRASTYREGHVDAARPH